MCKFLCLQYAKHFYELDASLSNTLVTKSENKGRTTAVMNGNCGFDNVVHHLLIGTDHKLPTTFALNCRQMNLLAVWQYRL